MWQVFLRLEPSCQAHVFLGVLYEWNTGFCNSVVLSRPAVLDVEGVEWLQVQDDIGFGSQGWHGCADGLEGIAIANDWHKICPRATLANE